MWSYSSSRAVIPNVGHMAHQWGIGRTCTLSKDYKAIHKGGIRILEIPTWGMAQNRLGTTVIEESARFQMRPRGHFASDQIKSVSVV